MTQEKSPTEPVTTDSKVLALIKEINKRKEEIAAVEAKTVKLTSCSFSFNEDGSSRINLNVETDVSKMIQMIGFMLNKVHSYQEAIKTYRIDEAPILLWHGYDVFDWAEDIHNRIKRVQLAKKKESLQKLEDRLNKLVSAELRAKLELEEIMKELE